MDKKEFSEEELSKIYFDFSEEETDYPLTPPQPRDFEKGKDITKCDSCGATYPDDEVPEKCGYCGANDFYFA